MCDKRAWLSPAKLNLFLYITGRRADGYHNLQTLFQFIDYSDSLYFDRRQDDKICLQTEFTLVPHDDNLIIKSANMLLTYMRQSQADFRPPFGIDITIDKKLPMGGGLGGGSSNAATTLIALNQLWQLGLSTPVLMQIGQKLGADVPIFIFGLSAFAQGIGDELVAIDVPEKWYLVVKPNVEIATAKIFNAPSLKRDSVTRRIDELLTTPFNNDCEPTVRALYPQIDDLINRLSQFAPTRLTGTGSCIFSECNTQEQAMQLQQHLAGEDVVCFIAKGINQLCR
ncbi:4-diphosphocytidyl-2-C-methyl-D-erythritol kinase [Orbus hercynius]|uniref:4-diphosphocytidyl-2-C-methyl-D-erythritol kinase n=1 Tax=Orbus hercynius TaxID=593135 RepID=A0A495RJW5_9GAMM|nr:4-(cytidine 5'-diphospho)-2-C-methyl-D-erythritol kinase [Orbus hercynius]RKS87604.1 4-diphosphocytidyl-2-C-methyl-D-erythritol kinase [Orbus hercynius]